MNFVKTLKSPWVIGGGVLIGAIVLLTRGSGGGNGQLDYIGALAQSAKETNLAGMELSARRDEIAAGIAGTRIESDAALRGTLVSAFAMKLQSQNEAASEKLQIMASLKIERLRAKTAIRMMKLQQKFRARRKNQSGHNRFQTGGVVGANYRP